MTGLAMQKSARVGLAFGLVGAADRELLEAVEDALPDIGERIEIPRGLGTVRGVLVRHSGYAGDPFRVYVRLDSTGCVFSLSTFPLFKDAIYGTD